MLETALHFSHTLLKEVVHIGDTVVDATMGNGYDTVFLAELVGKNGQVYAFDVQEQALTKTKEKLTEKNLLPQACLLLQGHETVAEVLPKNTQLQAAVFNLGFLPKSDKAIITKPETTIHALESLLDYLVTNGRIIVVAYYGHKGGEQELQAITEFCQALPQEHYNVLSYQFINQKNQPPILYCIEKK